MRMRAVVAVLVVLGMGAFLAGCDKGTPPTISTPPTAQTACVGGKVTFSVTAAGKAPLSYQWKKDGTAISGATNATYTIGSVAAGDAGSYTVVVTNAAGSITSAAAVLTVNVPPTITAQPAAQSACLGKSVLFSVTATGTPPFSYQWKKDGTTIAGATTAIYTIPAVTNADEGTYTVVVTNGCGSVTSTPAALSLGAAPTITSEPTAQTVCAGQPVEFTVAATGTPPLTYQWLKDGGEIGGATAATYTISAAASTDAGAYSATVANSCGTVTSRAAALTVGTAPTITAQPASQAAVAGSSATFSVTATGTPPFSYQWQRDNADIAGATEPSYTIPAVASADAGSYTVVVTNPCGSATSDPALLTVTPAATEPVPPPAVTGPFITVNGHPLDRAAFDSMRESILDYYAQLYAQFGIDIEVFRAGARGRLFDLDLDLTALTAVITRGLVEAEAERLGVVITGEETEAEFQKQYQAMLDTYGMAEQDLVDYFAIYGGTLEEFKEEGRASVTEQLLYAAVQQAVVGPIELSEDELRAYFEEHKADYSTEEQIEASHILVATAEEAQAILDELARGADFAELARTRSTDTGSAAQGGALGWFGRGVMAPEFEEAAFALEVGETSGIVQTDFGFHIIRVTDRRAASEPEFEEVADRVRADAERAIARERFDAWLKAAREEATVVISDPILEAMYLKDLDLDRGIAAFERIRDEGVVEEEYISFIIGSLYEEKMASLQSEIELLTTQLPEGPEREAEIARVEGEVEKARQAALAAYQEALKAFPDDEDVQERISVLEGKEALPR
ncbi:Immunoglobulin I-set domain-containing protein (modular protein) [Candidatus Bipolaricaulis anaerobius]|jgi:parvulin-like peptidyl-prolyl isomerase|uniref:Immunoglobulin I-set domain-containing protein (Modular protein) n=1 Tax=Candidatus Bipolaricaulis anaerobius TaxID=2026885 RepID=A0A2X3K6C9_9BACT|nr:immunoglobulin domain-containing protein [Candidatus Bipolaricaulis anaerobius]SQD92787.1 Immunoglobulin I-set domain-containing protein (modular protein) [Candidatus Bipolaricaulis anaerobius]